MTAGIVVTVLAALGVLALVRLRAAHCRLLRILAEERETDS